MTLSRAIPNKEIQLLQFSSGSITYKYSEFRYFVNADMFVYQTIYFFEFRRHLAEVL